MQYPKNINHLPLGLQYKGSKNLIARQIIQVLPATDTFVDLFAGGCAVTHAAILSGKYRHFIVNDIISDLPRFFVDAINGKYHFDTRWISRSDFHRLKDADPYVRLCWSFSHGQRNYIYGKTTEPYKRACHYAIVFDDWAQAKALFPETWLAAYHALQGVADLYDRRILFTHAIAKWIKTYGTQNIIQGNPVYRYADKYKKVDIPHMKAWIRMLHLERLRTIHGIDGLLAPSSLDYQSVPIPENATVYADPPYNNHSGYLTSFDHERFYQWLRTVPFPVYVSEFSMPPDFVAVARFQRYSGLKKDRKGYLQERIFVHQSFYNEKEIGQVPVPLTNG